MPGPYRIISYTLSAGADWSSAFPCYADAVKACAIRKANAPENYFEIVHEEKFQSWLDRQAS